MTKKTSLELSIEHWERLATGKRGAYEGCTGDQCALCDEFYDTEGDDEEYHISSCYECPVYQSTGYTDCEGSPWRAAHDAVRFGYDSPEFLAAAQQELDFLRGLK
jgi:hypothetical protein